MSARKRAPAVARDRTREEVSELAGMLREASDMADRLGYEQLASTLWRSRGELEHEANNIAQREMFAPEVARALPGDPRYLAPPETPEQRENRLGLGRSVPRPARGAAP